MAARAKSSQSMAMTSGAFWLIGMTATHMHDYNSKQE